MRSLPLKDFEFTWHEYVLAGLVGLFVIIKSFYLFPRFSDGNIYLYLSSLIAEGFLPYRDFFYSSPPVLLYVLAGWGVVFGFHWLSFAWVPVVLSSIDSVLLYAIGLRLFSKGGGVAAVALYLFSYAVFATTDFTSDVHVVLTLLLAGVCALVFDRPMLSGILLSAAVLTKLYAVVVVVGLCCVLLVRRRWSVLFRVVSIGLALGVVVGAAFLIISKGSAYEMVFASHFGEIAGLSKLNIFRYFVERDFIFAAVILAWFYFRTKISGFVLWPLLMLIVFFLFFHDIYYLYLKLLVAWLALWGGWVFSRLERLAYGRFLSIGVFVCLVGVASVNIWRWERDQSEAAVIGPFGELVEYVERITDKEDFVYGDFSIAPAVAVAADRSIWEHMADTNIKFFQTGYFDLEERGQLLAHDAVPLVVTKGLVAAGGNIVAGPESVAPISFFQNHCRAARSFPIERDYSHNAVIVWQCEY